jgi:hypothetical protein
MQVRSSYCHYSTPPINPSFGKGLSLAQIDNAIRGKTLHEAKQALKQLGFQGHSKCLHGPNGFTAYIDEMHGDHIDIKKNGTKTKIPVNFSARFA